MCQHFELASAAVQLRWTLVTILVTTVLGSFTAEFVSDGRHNEHIAT
jgi:hypothetical protein